MSGEYDKCGEHALECLCPILLPRKWIDREEAEQMFPLDVLGIDEDKFCSKGKYMELKLEKPISSEIIFCVDTDGSWIMKLTKKGIFFNRDKYPNAEPDDFAKAILEILEKKFTVKFEKNEPPYDREKTSRLQNDTV